VTYPVIERLNAKYASQGGVKIVVQTTGDILTDATVADLMDRGVWMISVASVDDFHVGLEGPERQKRFVDKLSAMFERHGLRRSGLSSDDAQLARGGRTALQLLRRDARRVDRQAVAARARVAARLSTATLEDNFCNRWSGGLNFLRHAYSGSEVSDRARRQRLPVLRQDQAPDRQPARGRPDRDPRLAAPACPRTRRSRQGHPERMGVRTAGPRPASSSARRRRRQGRSLREPVHRLRPLPRGGARPDPRGGARAAPHRARRRRARRARTIPAGDADR
jgi:hypothetical protein